MKKIILNLGFLFSLLIALMCSTCGLGVPEQKTKTDEIDASKGASNLKNAIVLVGLNELNKDFTGYGVIPVLEKDIINFFNLNATLKDKIGFDSRSFDFQSGEVLTASHTSRLLPLLTTPKKALLLFALHDTLLKSNKGQIDKKCVVLDKEDLESLLNGEITTTATTTAASTAG